MPDGNNAVWVSSNGTRADRYTDNEKNIYAL